MKEKHPTDTVMPDRPVSHPDEDRYGFRHVAQQLARSVMGVGREGCAVIGIEGSWGSGKTSLLNLLRNELEEEREDNTFVLSISPWLDGGNNSTVESLLIPVAAIIAREEERRLSPIQRRSLKKKKQLTETAGNVLRYTQATARHLAPAAEIAALFPGIPNTNGLLKALSEADLKGRGKTTAELRTEIAEKIVALDLSFIVLLDDLDRLEPAQAIEVIRLVKSVADFPRFRYLMCYDRAVLAQAIQNGLGVADGDLYLQKIVQISFSLPRPEAFDLRREFHAGAVSLYQSVNGTEPDQSIISDLSLVTDTYGASLKTPREVQLALSGLAFRYSGIRDYVYLPDLCFLQLIHITHNALYNWIEEYLTERAVVESGDGSVSEEEKRTLTEELGACLARFKSSQAKSATSLRRLIPGISGYNVENLSLFGQIPDEEKAEMTTKRRLGSGAYWRYYFAFSSPQNVLPPDYFNHLFDMASSAETYSALAEELLSRINSNGISSRTWFEHILSQLTWPMINTRSENDCAGMLTFFFHFGDEIIARYRQRNRWFSPHDLDIKRVVDRFLKQMLDANRDKAIELLLSLTVKGESLFWIADYIRHLLWQNGLAGNRVLPEQERILTNEELEQVRSHFYKRINGDKRMSQLPVGISLRSFVWAWRDIAGEEALKAWITQHSASDEDFLTLVLSLRNHIISSSHGHYLVLDLSDVGYMFGGDELLLNKLERIEAEGKFPAQIEEIRDAIELSKSF
ncbi:KAP family P-loop NTPase fold protein [Siccibacter colletis]|uniref:KAP family P-loop NTPase fold protein n=1 Tax=Siccibacter colletis TaxID=1505757 RepID=UPI003CE9E472